MSLKGGEGKVKQPTEQLRSDHITTLELLQKCTNENAKLKKEIKILKAGRPQNDGDADGKPLQLVPDALDTLELVEINAKQADEIKILKSRLSQAELQLLKFNQVQLSLQQNASQVVNDKLKKKERDMENGIFELENQLRLARTDLTNMRELMADLQKLTDSLKEEIHELKHINEEVYTVNGNLTATIGVQHSQVSSLKNELEILSREKKDLEISTEQKISDYRKLLSHQTEQNAILKKELSLQVEGAFQMQETNAQLLREKEAAVTMCCKLQTNIAELSSVIAKQQKLVNELQTTCSGEQDESETFKFTAPIVKAPEPAPEADGDSTFRFQEFLRLKRENKELKIRLADMDITSKRYVAGGGVSALTNPSASLVSSSNPQLRASLNAATAAGPANRSPRTAGSSKN